MHCYDVTFDKEHVKMMENAIEESGLWPAGSDSRDPFD